MSKVRPVQAGIRNCPNLVALVSSAWGCRGEANPELCHSPSLGSLQGGTHTGQVLQSSSQWEPIALSHVWEGGRDTLCVLINVMHLSIYRGLQN